MIQLQMLHPVLSQEKRPEAKHKCFQTCHPQKKKARLRFAFREKIPKTTAAANSGEGDGVAWGACRSKDIN